MTGARLRQALAYAARGWPVFPCQAGQKTPATAHGHLDATTGPGQITVWYARHPLWNLAIATGAPGPDVLDVDDHGPAGNGYAAFARLSKAGLADGAAAYVRTPGGGLHAYFRGSDQRNGHMPAHHLDFRSRGGYILAPPSCVNGTPYQLIQTMQADGGLDWATVTALLEPGASPSGRSRARPQASPTWLSGSPASPKGTATPACSGPPTAPWTPTPSPTSAPWPPPPAKPAWTTRRSPKRSIPPAKAAGPAPTHPTTRPRQETRHDREHFPGPPIR
jgi:hypothetical protein